VTITPTTLVRASAAAAVAAGAIFIGVQVGHPHLDADSVTTAEMAVRGTLKVVMAVLSLVGISGMYLTHVRRNGLLGFVGYTVFAAGYLMVMATSFVAAYVLPTIAATNRNYTQSVLDVATGGSAATDIGALEPLVQGQGALYLAGGLLFGIALFRANVLPRWASALLAVSGLASAALAVMPDAFYRLLAFPNGIALIALGYGLWRTTNAPTRPTVTADVTSGRPRTTDMTCTN
jgi:hypothetical protein